MNSRVSGITRISLNPRPFVVEKTITGPRDVEVHLADGSVQTIRLDPEDTLEIGRI
mgnify:CR=1 FL=1